MSLVALAPSGQWWYWEPGSSEPQPVEREDAASVEVILDDATGERAWSLWLEEARQKSARDASYLRRRGEAVQRTKPLIRRTPQPAELPVEAVPAPAPKPAPEPPKSAVQEVAVQEAQRVADEIAPLAAEPPGLEEAEEAQVEVAPPAPPIERGAEEEICSDEVPDYALPSKQLAKLLGIGATTIHGWLHREDKGIKRACLTPSLRKRLELTSAKALSDEVQWVWWPTREDHLVKIGVLPSPAVKREVERQVAQRGLDAIEREAIEREIAKARQEERAAAEERLTHWCEHATEARVWAVAGMTRCARLEGELAQERDAAAQLALEVEAIGAKLTKAQDEIVRMQREPWKHGGARPVSEPDAELVAKIAALTEQLAKEEAASGEWQTRFEEAARDNARLTEELTSALSRLSESEEAVEELHERVMDRARARQSEDVGKATLPPSSLAPAGVALQDAINVAPAAHLAAYLRGVADVVEVHRHRMPHDVLRCAVESLLAAVEGAEEAVVQEQARALVQRWRALAVSIV